MSINDTLTGQKILSRERRYREESKRCEDDHLELDSLENLRRNALAGLSAALAGDILPSRTNKPFRFIETDETLNSLQQHLVAQAYHHAESGDLDRARELYSRVIEESPSSGVTLFNLGLVEQAIGNFTLANEYFLQARNVGGVPQRVLERQIQEVDDWLNRGFDTAYTYRSLPVSTQSDEDEKDQI